MKSPLRILHLEDDPHDAELLHETLESEGIASEVTRVEAEADFVAALQHSSFDLILADYTLPSFDGLSALRIAQRDRPQIPFIFVSGTLGEEVAVEALKFGATDYVFKTRLFRIIPSVRRALREAKERADLQRSEAALRLSEAYLTEAQKISRTGSFGWNVSTGAVYWSEETFRIFGCHPATEINLDFIIQRIHPEDRESHAQLLERAAKERQEWVHEHRLLMPDGTVKHLRVIGHPSQDASGQFEFVGAITDITELKRSEEEMRKLASLVENSTDFIGMASLQGDVLFLNPAGQMMLGLAGDRQVRESKIADYIAEQDLQKLMNEVLPAVFNKGRWEGETLFKHFQTGASVPVWQYIFFITEEGSGRRLALATICRDITERKRVEEELRRSENNLAQAQRLTHTGSWVWRASDRASVHLSEEWFHIFGFSPDEGMPAWEKRLERVHPEDRGLWQGAVDRVIRERSSLDLEFRINLPDGTERWLKSVGQPVFDSSGEFVEFVGSTMDITERKRSEYELRRSETYLAEAQKLSHTGSWAFSVPAIENVYWSQEMYRIFGLEPSPNPPSYMEVASRLLHPEDTEYHSIVQQAIRDKTDYETEYRLVFPDGTLKYIRATGHPVLNASGEVVEVVGTAMDVTEQNEARAALEIAFAEIKKLKDQLLKENIALRDEINKTSMFEEIVGESPALQSVLARVAKVAPTDSTVLITGETGTGKELIARAIHKRSPRSSRAFVSVNCAAIPATLISSELFGHEKGAFTGALSRRLGRFELAEGGTIFLDEIGELPPETQIALLRILQEREFERIGGTHPIRADIRVITATNRDLESAIAAGTFRRDLFYRLNVFPIEVPPLRERREDIPTLVKYFIHRYSRKAGKKIETIETATMELLQSYAWPGNIRELQNVIERSVIVCDTSQFSVDPSWLSLDSSPSGHHAISTGPVPRKSAAQEREAIEEALAATGGRVSGPQGAAARLLMPASTLESKIRALKINKFRFRGI
jgi:PAS domain S-box-containing protein